MLRLVIALALPVALVGPFGPLTARDKPDEKKDVKKPAKVQASAGGHIKSIDVKARTVTLHYPFQVPPKETTVTFDPDATVFIDGKEGKFEDLPVGSRARVAGGKVENSLVTDATEIAVVGRQFQAFVRKLGNGTITYTPDVPAGNKPRDETAKLAADLKVLVGGAEAKLADVKVGDKVTLVFTADDKAIFHILKAAPPKKK